MRVVGGAGMGPGVPEEGSGPAWELWAPGLEVAEGWGMESTPRVSFRARRPGQVGKQEVGLGSAASSPPCLELPHTVWNRVGAIKEPWRVRWPRSLE